MTQAIHPRLAARVVRAARGLRHVRGWRRVAAVLAGSEGDFRVRNGSLWTEGTLGSYIERQAYLFGGYERDEIDLFLDAIPRERRGTMLDIGANVGTHTLRFARVFRHVHAFEPNPLVVDRLRHNVALNDLANVEVHQVGLSDTDGTLQLYAPSGGNQGLGTFSAADQYDRPLESVGTARIAVGDRYVAALAGGERVDAIKCDVQGFELAVFRGLAATVARDRPMIWVELGSGAHTVAEELERLLPLFPRPARYLRLTAAQHGPLTRSVAREVTEAELGAGDYVVLPR